MCTKESETKPSFATCVIKSVQGTKSKHQNDTVTGRGDNPTYNHYKWRYNHYKWPAISMGFRISSPVFVRSDLGQIRHGGTFNTTSNDSHTLTSRNTRSDESVKLRLSWRNWATFRTLMTFLCTDCFMRMLICNGCSKSLCNWAVSHPLNTAFNLSDIRNSIE